MDIKTKSNVHEEGQGYLPSVSTQSNVEDKQATDVNATKQELILATTERRLVCSGNAAAVRAQPCRWQCVLRPAVEP